MYTVNYGAEYSVQLIFTPNSSNRLRLRGGIRWLFCYFFVLPYVRGFDSGYGFRYIGIFLFFLTILNSSIVVASTFVFRRHECKNDFILFFLGVERQFYYTVYYIYVLYLIKMRENSSKSNREMIVPYFFDTR